VWLVNVFMFKLRRFDELQIQLFPSGIAIAA